MPTESNAVTCAHCKRMHPVKGKYLVVTATVLEHPEEKEVDGHRAYHGRTKEAESVKVEDVAVCDNSCLCNLLSLKGC